MQCACQFGCYYITIPYRSHPLRYFKDVYKPASVAQRLWLKGRGNLFTIGHRCATALRPVCAIIYNRLISKTDPFPRILIYENHRPYYQQTILVYFKLNIKKVSQNQMLGMKIGSKEAVRLSYQAIISSLSERNQDPLSYMQILADS